MFLIWAAWHWQTGLSGLYVNGMPSRLLCWWTHCARRIRCCWLTDSTKSGIVNDFPLATEHFTEDAQTRQTEAYSGLMFLIWAAWHWQTGLSGLYVNGMPSRLLCWWTHCARRIRCCWLTDSTKSGIVNDFPLATEHFTEDAQTRQTEAYSGLMFLIWAAWRRQTGLTGL